jgi:hemerythrin
MPKDCDLRLTNLDLIDDDHEQLLHVLQELAYGEGLGRAGMDRLIVQVMEHFDHELPHLERIGGALKTRHLRAHALFLDRLTAIRNLCESEPDHARADLAEITARFISHTNTDDLEIVEALKTLAPVAAQAEARPAVTLDDILW